MRLGRPLLSDRATSAAHWSGPSDRLVVWITLVGMAIRGLSFARYDLGMHASRTNDTLLDDSNVELSEAVQPKVTQKFLEAIACLASTLCHGVGYQTKLANKVN